MSMPDIVKCQKYFKPFKNGVVFIVKAASFVFCYMLVKAIAILKDLNFPFNVIS